MAKVLSALEGWKTALLRETGGARGTAQQAKVLAAKSANPSLILGSQMVEGTSNS